MRFPPVKAKNVLVTGCSSGIGAATARFLQEQGWNVVPTARKPEDLERLRSLGFTPVSLDVAHQASIEKAVEETMGIFNGQVGGVVNNAGFGQPGAVEDVSREALTYQFEVNVFGLQELTNKLLPTFREQGWGRIVNVSSVLGRICLPFVGAYCASKHALEALSDSMRIELRGTGVAVAIVEPGPIATRFGDNANERGKSTLDMEASRFGRGYERELSEDRPPKKHMELFRKPPVSVAKKILHALESSRPKTRYPVTFPAHAGAILRRVAPDRMLDYIAWKRAQAYRDK